jgi:hypothetical protein
MTSTGRHAKEQMAEAMEKPMMEIDSSSLSPTSIDNIKGLVQFAKLLVVPSGVRKVIAELDKATTNSRAAAAQAKAVHRDLVRLKHDLENELRERAEHDSAMARERAEVDAIKEAALELKAKAEADAAAAKWIKDDLLRRFKPVAGAE